MITISPSAGVESNALETASATRVDDLDVLGREAELDRRFGDHFGSQRARAGRPRAHELRDVVEPERGEHLDGLALPQQSDHERARRRRELLGERGAQRLRAGNVVRAVEQHERMTADDLEPSRRTHAVNASYTASASSGAPTNASAAASAIAGVVALVRAVAAVRTPPGSAHPA